MLNRGHDLKQKYELKLKPINTSNSDNLRIYGILKNSCEGLNNYLADFYETIEILKEKKEKSAAEPAEVEASIEFVLKKIDDVTLSMRTIAQDMHSLIELIEHKDI
jgi:hypothetical protein